MDKTIDITIKGSYLRKNNNSAGVQGEGNVTILHIIFDDAWEGLAKSVTFWDARGENPVKRTLTSDLLVDINVSLLEYNVPIPSEPLAHAGDMTFIIDGYLDGKRKRTMQDTLSVEAALISDTENEPIDPTPTQAEQLQEAIESILPSVMEEVQKAVDASEGALSAVERVENNIDSAVMSAEKAKTSEVNAKVSEDSAEADALLSKSYAVGGTGIRSGEDTDNAKYYYEQTKGITGGDFVTNPAFNSFVTNSFNPLAQEVSENTDKIAVLNDGVSKNAEDVSKLTDTVNGISFKTTALETTINSLINGEAVQY